MQRREQRNAEIFRIVIEMLQRRSFPKMSSCLNITMITTISVRRLYLIRNRPQGVTLATVLSADDAQEFGRLEEFFDSHYFWIAVGRVPF